MLPRASQDAWRRWLPPTLPGAVAVAHWQRGGPRMAPLVHAFLLVPAQAGVAEFLKTFKEFPPRQKAASFSVDQVIDRMTDAAGGGQR